MNPEQLKLMAVEQSAQAIQTALYDIEGIANALLQTPDAKAHGYRLQGLQAEIGQALMNIGYIVAQGQKPDTPDQLAIGQKVQEAINEISQI